MTTKEELLKIIQDIRNFIKNQNSILLEREKELKYEIDNDRVQPVQYGRWKPWDIKDKRYWYIRADGEISSRYWLYDSGGFGRYSIGNCYQSREQAEQALERLKTRTQLEDIALRLNKGHNIDWKNEAQKKYYLIFDSSTDIILQYLFSYMLAEGAIYCLDENFKDVAISEIGKERLAKYLKGV